jgi:hypothetical protein
VEQGKLVPLMSSGWAAVILADKKSANAIARPIKFWQRVFGYSSPSSDCRRQRLNNLLTTIAVGLAILAYFVVAAMLPNECPAQSVRIGDALLLAGC